METTSQVGVLISQATFRESTNHTLQHPRSRSLGKQFCPHALNVCSFAAGPIPPEVDSLAALRCLEPHRNQLRAEPLLADTCVDNLPSTFRDEPRMRRRVAGTDTLGA